MKIYNTLAGKKDELKPVKGKKINLFVCGPTVYDYAHIGHARCYVFFDMFVKYLKQKGINVFYLQNITDLDDKIIARAREKKVSPQNLAEAFTKEYLKDMKTLGVDSVNKYAPATKFIKEIISQVERLKEKGFAYEIEGDGVYFDISKFKNYGKLSGRTALGAEDAVSRIDYSKEKKNRGDFCLWKLKQESSEPSWASPFGEGRPGWHIEDTAITENFFGAQYDIHGGARDLIFPHHEAEICQMESVSGKSPLVRYWMHVGFLTVNGQKMSKSLGNFITINDFLKRCNAQYLRFYIAKTHWRSPMDYSESAMIEVKSAVSKIEETLFRLKNQKLPAKSFSAQNSKNTAKFLNDFYKELEDDFNAPRAFAVLFDFLKNTNQLLDRFAISRKEASEIWRVFEKINKIFGFIDFKKISKPIPLQIKNLAKERDTARKNQDWGKSDSLRQEIETKGFVIEDTKSGTQIRPLL